MIQSIQRAMTIIELFRSEKNLSLTEISQMTGLTKTTVYGIVETLVSGGYLEQDEITKQYSLGITLMEMGSLYGDRLDLRSVAMPYMHELEKATGEAVQLGCIRGGDVVFLARTLTVNYMKIIANQSGTIPAYCSAIGKAIMANMQPEKQESCIRNLQFEKLTPNTITDAEQLRQELKAIRSKGYSFDNGENNINVFGIGVPIFTRNGKVVAGISLGCMNEPTNREYINSMLPKIQETANKISYHMGYEGAKRR